MEIYNEKSLKEIQAMRELEGSGNIKEQLAYVLEVQESNKDLTEKSVCDLSLAMGQMIEATNQAVAELTMLISTNMAMQEGDK